MLQIPMADRDDYENFVEWYKEVKQSLKSGLTTALLLQMILRSIRKGSAVITQIKAMWGAFAKGGVESQRWGANAKKLPPKRKEKGGVQTQMQVGSKRKETSHTAHI